MSEELDLLVLSEEGPLPRALSKVLLSIGYVSHMLSINVHARHGFLQLERCVSSSRVILLLHHDRSIARAAQYCCLAAKLRCPPISSTCPISVCSTVEHPIKDYEGVADRRALDELSIGVQVIARAHVLEWMELLQELLNSKPAVVLSHERSLPLWVLALEIAAQGIEHQLGNRIAQHPNGETERLANTLMAQLFNTTKGDMGVTMKIKYVLLIDDALGANDPADRRANQAITFGKQLKTALSQQFPNQPCRYSVEEVPTLETVAVLAKVNQAAAGPNRLPPLVVVLDLIDDQNRPDQTKSLALIQALDAMTPRPHVIIWTAAFAGPAYQEAKAKGYPIFQKADDAAAERLRIADYIRNLP